MPLPFRVDWYAIYGACVDAVWLADIILRHADVLTNAAAALQAVQDEEQQQDIVFVGAAVSDSVDHPNGDVNALDALDDGDNVDSHAPFANHLASAV